MDEVAHRAALSAIADMEQQRREEEEKWAHPSDELIANFGEASELPEGTEECDNECQHVRQSVRNLNSIRWMGPARIATFFSSSAQTAADSAELHAWEQSNVRTSESGDDRPSYNLETFPEELVFPPNQYAADDPRFPLFPPNGQAPSQNAEDAAE